MIQAALKSARKWWIPTSSGDILEAQHALLSYFVNAPLHAKQIEVFGEEGIPLLMNCVDTASDYDRTRCSGASIRNTAVLGHGLGSGLGLFFNNYDGLLKHFDRVVGFDWIGFGNSSRPAYTDGVNFFIDPLRQFLGAIRLQEKEKFTLIGHSLGGYLCGIFASLHPEMVQRVILASPVGLAKKPDMGGPGPAPNSNYGIFKNAWEAGLTPGTILRAAGPKGLAFVKHIVEKRFGKRWPEHESQLISNYLYQINAHDASGEYAMRSLLQPVFQGHRGGIFARTSLHEALSRMRQPVPLHIVYGDHDWLYEGSNPLYRCHETVDVLRRDQTISVSLDVLPMAGHHLHLDNSVGFNNFVVEKAFALN